LAPWAGWVTTLRLLEGLAPQSVDSSEAPTTVQWTSDSWADDLSVVALNTLVVAQGAGPPPQIGGMRGPQLPAPPARRGAAADAAASPGARRVPRITSRPCVHDCGGGRMSTSLLCRTEIACWCASTRCVALRFDAAVADIHR
jgi:hypothetical protein